MRAFAAVVGVVMALALAACGDNSTPAGGGDGAATGRGGAAPSGGAVKIGFLVKQADDPWFQNEWKFAGQAAEKNGFELIKIGLLDGPKTLAAIDTLAGQGAQGFIICTPEPKIGQAIVDRAARSGMKVMSVDDRLQSADGKDIESVPHMGITARDIGRLVGQALAEEYKKRGWKQEETGACILTHDPGGQTHIDRTQGAEEALKAAGFAANHIFEIPQKEELGLATGRDAMNSMMTQHPEIKNWLIAGVNDGSVAGAVRATEGRGLPAERVAGVGIGVDSSLTDLSQAKPTGFLATVLISPRRHGYDTCEMMYKWIKEGVEPPKVTWTQGILINRENYKQVMKEQGLTQ
jgi:L-arabinose transport system substrate-binding protein